MSLKANLIIFQIFVISLFIHSSLTLNIYEIYNYIITNNINHTNVTSEEDIISKRYYYYTLNTKGVGLVLDYNSEKNFIPYFLLRQIKRILGFKISECYSYFNKTEEGYEELIIYSFKNKTISFHMITQNFGITIPNEILFPNVESKNGINRFLFYSEKDKENIIFGKNLIDLMNIQIKSNGEFIINNSDFLTKIKED